MTKTELTDYLKTILSGCEISEGKQFAEIKADPDKLYSVANALKNNDKIFLDMLVSITGMDYGKELGAVYHIRSSRHNHTIVLKVRTEDRINPNFDSVTGIWRSAEFLEREVYDLLGIRFNNHPDLRRLFLDNSWGFPLRKDYVDDINIVTK
jgi:NADH:ubiquinone oxidoreductase subunit C